MENGGREGGRKRNKGNGGREMRGEERKRTEIERRKRRGTVANLGRKVGERRKTERCRMEVGKETGGREIGGKKEDGNFRKRSINEDGD